MRRSVFSLLLLASLLAACRPAAGAAPGSLPPARQTPTAVPTRTPLPTLTPTFDPAANATRTPAPPARCPAPNDSAAFKFTRSLQIVDAELLDYLNRGGEASRIQTAFDVWKAEGDWTGGASQQGGRVLAVDVTGDNVPEILVDVYQKQQAVPQRFFVFGCEAGHYRTLAELTSRPGGQQYDFPLIEDMNRDGVPEIVVGYRSGREPNLYLTVLIFEWDGHDFKNLMAQDDTMVNASYEVRDMDHNGILDLVMSGGQYAINPSTGQSVVTWVWNGQKFVRAAVEEGFAAPVYRFQAIREGDAASRSEELGLALALYDQAIMDETLLGWSPAWLQLPGGVLQTPAPTPPPDPDERVRLESYARYRIMVAYAILGYDQEASIEYMLLQNEISSTIAAPYAQLAAAFWQAYLPRRDVSSACRQAIDYARAHPGDVLTPLGSRFYGPAYPDYTPEEICPFK